MSSFLDDDDGTAGCAFSDSIADEREDEEIEIISDSVAIGGSFFAAFIFFASLAKDISDAFLDARVEEKVTDFCRTLFDSFSLRRDFVFACFFVP